MHTHAVHQDSLEQKHFIEEVGLLFETVGFPRMAGRVFGWLLISNPPHQSPGELATILQASKGSISTMTRLLEQLGLIERISLPGHRRDYFRIKLNAWSELTKRRTAQITAFRKLAERGLALIAEETPQLRQRLQEMHDIHAFFEQELPRSIERWEAARSQPVGANSPNSEDDSALEALHLSRLR
ncbi:MAG: MarR family transcriptional regulator [Leptolyngbyaceae cyanobacterium RU_5_1]|nr:MarR family transcriptional regulator [Leptolyngbyaceae cyanobacterium RU_5_1]